MKNKKMMKTLEGKWKYLLDFNKYFVFNCDGTFETNHKMDKYGRTVDGTYTGSYTVTTELIFKGYKLNLKYYSDKYSFYIDILDDKLFLYLLLYDTKKVRNVVQYRRV